ncbi:MAG: glycosyltransferase family 4 protein [Pseudomonadota bacterium]
MRILVIVSEFPKVTETFAVANVRHYLDAGHEVDLFHIKSFRHGEIVHDEARPVVDRAFTFPWAGRASLGAMLVALLTRPLTLVTILGTLIWVFRREPKRLLASLALLPKSLAVARKAGRDGVAHINAEFASHPGTSAWIMHRMTGLPFSMSAHMHDIFVSQSFLAQKSQDAAFVRTISEYNMEFLGKIPGFDTKKLALVRCGVDLTRFQLGPDAHDRPRDGPFEIAFVGSLQPRKGCDLLLKALAQITANLPWHLTIVGGGPEEPRLRELSAALPESQVTFTGPKPSADVRRVMSAADLVVAPSIVGEGGRSEGIPVVTMEALALVRPLISSRLSGIPELVVDGETGRLVEPGDIDALAAAIDWVISHPAEAAELGRAGRRRVEAEYDIRRNAADLLALIERNAA